MYQYGGALKRDFLGPRYAISTYFDTFSEYMPELELGRFFHYQVCSTHPMAFSKNIGFYFPPPNRLSGLLGLLYCEIVDLYGV